jgi:hypothetical protein
VVSPKGRSGPVARTDPASFGKSPIKYLAKTQGPDAAAMHRGPSAQETKTANQSYANRLLLAPQLSSETSDA